MTCVTDLYLYHAYEEFHELVLLDPNDSHKDEFTHIQDSIHWQERSRNY